MDEETAEIRMVTSPMLYVPHEVVTEILLRLPVNTLVRFRRVCRAWRHTISDDTSFQGTHLHRHRTDPSLLIAPWIYDTDKLYLGGGVAAGLYHWEQDHTHGAAKSLVIMPVRAVPEFAHCDGLVLVGTESAAWVLNPTTRRIRALHRSFGILVAFGLGRDPRSNTYKVARFYDRTKHVPVTGYIYTTCVEVFTIGSAGQCWHETAQPPCTVRPRETATFFKGSLIWIIGYHKHRYSSTLGFLRLRLDGETFSLIAPPPGWSWDMQDTSTLCELREELCLTTSTGVMNGTLEIWICNDLDKSRWEKQYNILSGWNQPLCPIAMLSNRVLVCRSSGNYLHRCTYQPGKSVSVNHTIRMKDLRYYHVSEDTLVDVGEGTVVEYPSRTTVYFNALPYVPSFVSI